jgi:hypothetical protein
VPTISWAVEVLGGDTVIEAPRAIGARPMARADAVASTDVVFDVPLMGVAS